MPAASQLPGREPTDNYWMMLLHLHVNLNAAAAADDDDECYSLLSAFVWFSMV